MEHLVLLEKKYNHLQFWLYCLLDFSENINKINLNKMYEKLLKKNYEK